MMMMKKKKILSKKTKNKNRQKANDFLVSLEWEKKSWKQASAEQTAGKNFCFQLEREKAVKKKKGTDTDKCWYSIKEVLIFHWVDMDFYDTKKQCLRTRRRSEKRKKKQQFDTRWTTFPTYFKENTISRI